ncbi:MAG: PC4/YdbC family ssDNA-binding protein [Succinivibrionaceae bacterium]|nr:PC4/YdbC family ssDNA-binding protein [Succinivibrionaceae bacterium]
MEEKENSRGGRKSEIRFDIKQHLGVLSASNRGWNKELNLVSWNGGNAKLDLRDWDETHEKMGKGVTLTPEEAEKLYELLGVYLGK